MMMCYPESSSKREQILHLAGAKGIVRPRDLLPLGIDPSNQRRLTETGSLQKLARGLFTLPTRDLTEHHTLAEVAACCPHAIICLLSAARFHNLGTESPGPIWVALARGKSRPTHPALPQLHVVWFAPAALRYGIESHCIEGVPVWITSPARTVVDLFRFRHRVSLETALDTLRDALAQGVTVREIMDQAAPFHMQNRIRPYLEALI